LRLDQENWVSRPNELPQGFLKGRKNERRHRWDLPDQARRGGRPESVTGGGGPCV